MPTPPTGTRTPTRPEAVIEQPRLFAASIIEDLGTWRHQWSRDMTRGVFAWISRMHPDRPAVVAIAAYILLTMGGRLRSTASAPQIAAEMGLSVQAVRDSLSRLYRSGIFEPLGRGRGRVILPGPVLRLSIETSPSRPAADNEHPRASIAPGRWIDGYPSPGGDTPENQLRELTTTKASDDPKTEPQRLPWETDELCRRCGTGRLALKPSGETDDVCKDCRRAEVAAAKAAAETPPGPFAGAACAVCGSEHVVSVRSDGGRCRDHNKPGSDEATP